MAESVTWMDPNSLREWSKNPKQHDTANVQTLARSLRRFGFVAPVVVWGSQKQIVAGHGRCRAALLILKADPGAYLAIDAPGPGLIPVRVVEFASASEADMYAIQDNRSTESNPMDPAAIAEILRELDAEGEEIEIPAYSDEEIASMLGGEAEEKGGDDRYTNKIKIPIYEPHLPAPPPVSSLYDASKSLELRAEIDAANLPPNVAAFLRVAADRHTSFHFKNIAEFYAHASPEVQRLFERSALVIIDFDAAIENGFVKLTDRLTELAGIEVEDDE